jgi:TPR repeat protein
VHVKSSRDCWRSRGIIPTGCESDMNPDAFGTSRMFKSDIRLCLVVVLLGIISLRQSVAQEQASSRDPLSADKINQVQMRAQAGDPVAQLNLGRAYDDGNGVSQSDSKAVKWYRAAAEQGNATAQNNLGLMFRSGRGVQQDKAEALNWYHKAAKQKNSNAMFNLGTAYYNGDGIPVNDVNAYAWFLLGQKFGSRNADAAVVRMTEEARDLPSAYERIGDMYQKGDELPQSSGEAVDWYRKAAENGTAPVQMKLASLLLDGRAGTLDYAEVHGLCEKAAKLHYSPADYCMGELYAEGLGVERDLSKAAQWFTEGSNSGHALSTLRLGQMYMKGEGLQQDKISAYEFIYLAATSPELPQAKQEKERLEKELTPKELKKAKTKADDWSRQHHPLVLRGSNPLTVH